MTAPQFNLEKDIHTQLAALNLEHVKMEYHGSLAKHRRKKLHHVHSLYLGRKFIETIEEEGEGISNPRVVIIKLTHTDDSDKFLNNKEKIAHLNQLLEVTYEVLTGDMSGMFLHTSFGLTSLLCACTPQRITMFYLEPCTPGRGEIREWLD